MRDSQVEAAGGLGGMCMGRDADLAQLLARELRAENSLLCPVWLGLVGPDVSRRKVVLE